MQWIEIAFNAAPDEGDIIADMLQSYGHQGVSIEVQGIMPEMYNEGELPEVERVIVRTYIPNDERTPDTLAHLEGEVRAHGWSSPEIKSVDDQDWAEAWKVHYHTTRIGRNVVVRPMWEDYTPEPDDIVISLDPGMAFGTGTHATTQLCLASLEALIQPGLRVLDLGTGSGILAIAAVKLGASEVLAVDNDPVAVKVTDENTTVNGVNDRVTAIHGSLETVLGSARRFDLLVANILARIIIEMAGQGLGQVVRPGGKAIFSGIVADQVEDVNAALRATGLEPIYVRRQEDGDWVAIEAIRPAMV